MQFSLEHDTICRQCLQLVLAGTKVARHYKRDQEECLCVVCYRKHDLEEKRRRREGVLKNKFREVKKVIETINPPVQPIIVRQLAHHVNGDTMRPMEAIMRKDCSKCRRNKAFDQFYLKKGKPDSWCIDCAKECAKNGAKRRREAVNIVPEPVYRNQPRMEDYLL